MHLVGQGQNIIAIHYQWGHNDRLSNLGLALQNLAPNQQLLLYNIIVIVVFYQSDHYLLCFGAFFKLKNLKYNKKCKRS